jgi:hypothetical protein
MWQIMRINSVEVALFDLEISGIDQYIHGNYETMDQYGRLALAFKKSAGDNALELLRRYKSTAERAYHRALQAIEEIQKGRKPQTQQNEIADQTREEPPAPDPEPESPTPEPRKPALILLPNPSTPTSEPQLRDNTV